MDEDLIQFIKEQRNAYLSATGQMPNDETVSRYALAYQLAVLNANLEEYIAQFTEPEGEE